METLSARGREKQPMLGPGPHAARAVDHQRVRRLAKQPLRLADPLRGAAFWIEPYGPETLGSQPQPPIGGHANRMHRHLAYTRIAIPSPSLSPSPSVKKAGFRAQPDGVGAYRQKLVIQLAVQSALRGEALPQSIPLPARQSPPGQAQPNGAFPVLKNRIDGSAQILAFANQSPGVLLLYRKACRGGYQQAAFLVLFELAATGGRGQSQKFRIQLGGSATQYSKAVFIGRP